MLNALGSGTMVGFADLDTDVIACASLNIVLTHVALPQDMLSALGSGTTVHEAGLADLDTNIICF